MFSRFICVIACISTSLLFILLLNTIPLYGYTIFCLSIHLLTGMWLFLPFDYCAYCCYERVCTSFCTSVFNCLGFPRFPACSTDLGRYITECRRIRYYESIKEGHVALIQKDREDFPWGCNVLDRIERMNTKVFQTVGYDPLADCEISLVNPTITFLRAQLKQSSKYGRASHVVRVKIVTYIYFC